VRRRLAVSVGRRLAALLGVQAATAAVLLAVAFAGYGRLASDLGFMRRYVLSPIEGISQAMDAAAQLKLSAEAAIEHPPDLALMQQWNRDVGVFLETYRTDWAVADNASEDALRFRLDLERAKRADLQADEKGAMNAAGRCLERIDAGLASAGSNARGAAAVESDARDLRTALRHLLQVNVAFMDVESAAIMRRSRQSSWWMTVVGLAGLAGSLALGLHVHRAIAPRIRRLVQEVQRFKQIGVHQRVLEEGRDEIAILANALDAGFAAIAARDRDRERFLAIVAHELALSRPENAPVRARALDLVRSHASRLGRLIDDLLLAASTRSGALPFRPQSIDASALTQKVAAEVTIIVPARRFEVHVSDGRHLLADEHLLTQAVWTLLMYAAAVAETGCVITVRLESEGARLRLEVSFDAPSVPAEEIERAFAPFAAIQYEGGSGIRSAVGLFLCREIARVHGGSLVAMNPTPARRTLVLDLPA
jgi:signal transduction histidine kinase